MAGGAVDEGEEPSDAARRKPAEETGLRATSMPDPEHLYTSGGVQDPDHSRASEPI
ncbi:NUDIX domain-containing protein [Streptomyces hokutonensis]|uniref:NUDIX domain-containing protein n=1 Tax=Streptomyces hokutonensis TaxID=1306990 RepID=A0ABW6M7Z4_9ACTN